MICPLEILKILKNKHTGLPTGQLNFYLEIFLFRHCVSLFGTIKYTYRRMEGWPSGLRRQS